MRYVLRIIPYGEMMIMVPLLRSTSSSRDFGKQQVRPDIFHGAGVTAIVPRISYLDHTTIHDFLGIPRVEIINLVLVCCCFCFR